MNEKEQKDLKERIASVFLKEIIRSLRTEQITMAQAREYAVDFLKMGSYIDVDDARKKIHEFVEKYPKFDSMKVYIDTYKDEQNTSRVIDLMKKHLKEDNIDKALEVAQDKK